VKELLSADIVFMLMFVR